MITERQKHILAAIYHHAGDPIDAIAKKLNYRVHSVRRDIEQMLAHGIIRKQAFVDFYRLGFVQYELYISLGSQKSASVGKFLRFITDSSRVTWIGQFSGAFQYVLTICLRSPLELHTFISEMAVASDVVILNQQMSICLTYCEFPLRYFAKTNRGSSSSIAFGFAGNEILDTVDKEILEVLSGAAFANQSEVAKRLKLPLSTCNARIIALERKKIIVAYRYLVDFSKLGIQAYSLLIRTKHHSTEVTKRVRHFCEQNIFVGYFTENIGAFDYRIGVLVLHPAEILEVTQRLLSDLVEDIVECSVLTAFEYLKVGKTLQPPRPGSNLADRS